MNFVIGHLQELLNKSLTSNDFSHSSGWGGDVPLFAAFGSELVGEKLLGLPISLKLDRGGGAIKTLIKLVFFLMGGFFSSLRKGTGMTLQALQIAESFRQDI